MKTQLLKISLGAAMVATVLAIPMTASAQRWYRHPHDVIIVDPGYRVPPEGWHVRALVDQTERESNSMRYVFEHQMNHYDHRDRERLAEAKVAIQRMDESFEQLRRYADDFHPRAGRDQMIETVARASDVDILFARQRMARDIVGSRWDDLRADINRLARVYGIDPIRR